MPVDRIELILYVLVGAVAGMVYALRRIFIVEQKILAVERAIWEMDKKLSQIVKRKKSK